MQELVFCMKNSIVVSILFIISAFFISRHCSFFGSSTVGVVSSCFLYPVLRIQQSLIAPIQQWVSNRMSFVELQQKYAALSDDREQLLAENIALKSGNYYVRSTAELLAFKKRYEKTGERIVQVLARHLSTDNQFFLVNAGARHGIQKDMVAVYGNCLLGRVAHVYPWYCKVYLITDQKCKVAAACVKTGATGIHEGLNSEQQTTLSHVSHLEKIEVGDTLISSGEGLVFPQGFGLGTVVAAERGDLVYTITVKPLLDFNIVRYCTLLAKSESENGDEV
jgi:rod shape-determining protein MreC